MKKITCLIILFISLFVVTSCSKDENNSNNNTNDTNDDNSSNNDTNDIGDGPIFIEGLPDMEGNVVDEYILFADLDDNYDKDDEYFNFMACVDISDEYSNNEDLNDFSDKFVIYAENNESLGFEEELKTNSDNFEILTEWKDYSDYKKNNPPSVSAPTMQALYDYLFLVSIPRQLFKGNPNENSFIRLGIIEKQDDEYKQKSQITFVYQKDENGLLNKSEMVFYEDEVLEDEAALNYTLKYNANMRKEGLRSIIQNYYTTYPQGAYGGYIDEYDVYDYDKRKNLFNIQFAFAKSEYAPLKDIDGYAIGVENLLGDNNVDGYEKVENSYILYEFDPLILTDENYYEGIYSLPIEIIETNIDKCFFKQILYAIVDGEYYVVDYVYYESDFYYFYTPEDGTLYIGYFVCPFGYYDYYNRRLSFYAGEWKDEYSNATEIIKVFGF